MIESKDFSSYRKSYEKGLISDDLKRFSPYFIFDSWFEEAKKDKDILEPNAMTLCTIGADRYPKQEWFC